MRTAIDFKQFDNLPVLRMREEILARCKEAGYVVIRDAPFDLDDTDRCKAQFLRFCQRLGQPTPHSHEEHSFIWNIKPVKDSQSAFLTHSERNSASDLHTDSAFTDNPEDCFCLFAKKKADCEGGKLLILSAADLIKELRSTDEGRRAEEVLRTKAFPFAVPTIFKKKFDVEHEYNDGLILTEGVVRFRGDAIEEAMKQEPSLVTESQIHALNLVQNILQSSKLVQRLTLESGDLVVINNKTMLHGRTRFTDESRHLMRVRLRTSSPLESYANRKARGKDNTES